MTPTHEQRVEAAYMLLAAASEAYTAELREYRAELERGRDDDARAARVRAAWFEVVESREILSELEPGVRPAELERPGFL
jgi:hypothetical protein